MFQGSLVPASDAQRDSSAGKSSMVSELKGLQPSGLLSLFLPSAGGGLICQDGSQGEGKLTVKTKNLARPVIPVPERLGQEHHCESETNLDNILNFKPGDYRMRPCLTKQSKEEI